MAIHVGRNFCLAPFTQLTYSPSGRYSPCPEIGGRPWKNSPEESVVKLWSNKEFNSLRDSFKDNKQDNICNRCNEDFKKTFSEFYQILHEYDNTF